MIQYKLSNRQRKELDNGKLLNIALPVDADWSDDLPGSDQYRWIVDRLPEVTAESIYRVVVRKVPCDAINRPGAKMPSSYYGPILVGKAGIIVYYVNVVVVAVRDCEGMWRSEYPIAWPGGEMARRNEK